MAGEGAGASLAPSTGTGDSVAERVARAAAARPAPGPRRWLMERAAWAAGTLRIAWSDHLAKVGIVMLVLFLLAAGIGPEIRTTPPFESVTLEDGRIAKNLPPSRAYPAGTNRLGQDLLVQLLHGARMAIFVGLLAAGGGAIIGTLVGLTAGYYGRLVDQTLMRVTDVALAIPFLPFALVFLALFGPGLRNIVIILALLFWRSPARVVRSQVLTLKERPYIQAARAGGAGNVRIMFVHLLPNLLPLIFLYVALGIGGAVSAEASVSFLGFGDPLTATWGQILNSAFTAGAMRTAWWWVVFPGLALTLFVTSIYLVSRGYEEAVNPRLRRM
ncbi:MAG: ABC transporter permease [Chloroflexi bacterium]|nr:ABC transporter permease [Chloroflexota bacterium]